MSNQPHSTSALAVETLLRSNMVPDTIKIVFRRTVGQMKTAEEMLWREVAARMTLDALGITPEAIKVFDGMSKQRYDAYARTVREARRWFLSRFESADADEVFSLWNGDVFPVRNEIAKLGPVVAPKTVRKHNGEHLAIAA